MALSSAIVWEVNSSGVATNGGGFNSGASGTDYSQQTYAQVDIDGSAITATVNATTTKVNLFGYTSTNADIGNIVYFNGGTLTAGHYEITGQTGGNQWTLDRSAGTAGQTGTGSMGGCKNHPVNLITTTTPVVAGNKIYCKGAFTLSSSTDLDLPAIANVYVQGYTTTRGDGVRPTWTASGSSVTMVTVNSGSATGWLFDCIYFDGASQTSSRGTNLAAGQCSFKYCAFNAFTSNSGTSTIVSYFINCEFTNNATSTVFNGSSGNNNFFGCRWAGNSTVGFSGNNSSRNTFVGCLFHDNTGATTDGIQSAHAWAYFNIVNCTFDGCGRHGINLSTVASNGHIDNCLFTNNGGYGISTTATNPPIFVTNCADDGSNTSGPYTGLDAARLSGWVTLTGSPYIDRSSDDYRLDNTTGEGASCRGGGYPTSLGGATSSNNIGAFGTPNSSGGGLLSHRGMTGGITG